MALRLSGETCHLLHPASRLSRMDGAILGVDVGGTFTDFFLLRNGQLQIHKRPSSPASPADAILSGIEARDWKPEEVVHGSTVATNTVLERSGSKVALVTTAGFRDLLEIGRQARPGLYDLEPWRPPPLVPRDLTFEVAERIDHRGGVVQSLRGDEIERLLLDLSQEGAETVAVCLLFSYLNDEHEVRIGEALRRAGFPVALSSEVLPEPREYERASTTVLSAYVGPRMRAYLSDLEQRLEAIGCESLSVVQSNGGTLGVRQAAELAANTLLSGPAAGVAGAFLEASRLGYDKLITLDIGGTSTDVALCPGRIPSTTEWTIADLPVRLPAVDVHTVGAGGGSIAWIDDGGALRVGPLSAGANPGPAAYGRGGPVTVTDAELALGRLSRDSFLNGEFPVDPNASEEALTSLGLGSAQEAATGVLTVTNTIVSRALRLVSIERGFDPRDFTLVAFGGAGPLLACDLAEILEMPRVLIPRFPGVLSAMGMVLAGATRDYSAPLGDRIVAPQSDELLSEIETGLEELVAKAKVELSSEAVLEPSVDMRYEGQGYELTVPWLGSDLQKLLDGFHERHRQRYGHDSVAGSVHATTLRLRAQLSRPEMQFLELGVGPPDPRRALLGHRRVILDTARDVPVYSRELLLAGNRILGPAIVGQLDSTTLILPRWQAEVHPSGALILERI